MSDPARTLLEEIVRNFSRFWEDPDDFDDLVKSVLKARAFLEGREVDLTLFDIVDAAVPVRVQDLREIASNPKNSHFSVKLPKKQ